MVQSRDFGSGIVAQARHIPIWPRFRVAQRQKIFADKRINLLDLRCK